jgi:2-dehydropantoate 2-reductase
MLSRADHELTLIARGPHLEAIQRSGLTLLLEDGTKHVAKVHATQYIDKAGPQDVVLLTLKAHQIAPIVREMAVLIGPHTMIVTMQNGIPWWYFHRHGGEFEGRAIESVDPGGVISESLDPERLIGSVVYPAAEVTEPGVIRHIEGNRFSLGELDGIETQRVRTLSDAFIRAGLRAQVTAHLRAEIWLKLWGNLSFNPISALTQATLADICQFPLTRELATAMMREAQAIANKLGVQFRVSLERRIAGAEAVGKHKTSTLQDIENGRPIELAALIGSVVELAKLTGTPAPHIDAVYACASLLAKTLASKSGRLRVEPLR